MPHGDLPPPARLPDWLAGDDVPADPGPPVLSGLTLPDFGETPEPEPPPPPAPARKLTDTPPPRRPTADGWSTSHVPVTATPDDAPGGVVLAFVVKNHSATEAREYRAGIALPPTLGGVRAAKSARRTAQGVVWRVGTVPPRGAIRLTLRLPAGPATQKLAAAPPPASLIYRPLPTPRLAATASPPVEAVVAGEPAVVRVRVANQGTAPCRAYRVAAFRRAEPTAAAEASGQGLPVGQSHVTELHLPPGEPGRTPWRVVVTADGLPPVEAAVEVVTAGVDLGLTLACPARIETDEETTCRVVVTNPSRVAVGRVAVSLAVPEALVFRGADARGTLDEAGANVVWQVAEIPAGGRWEAAARILGFAPGRVLLTATARAPWARSQAAEAPLVCEVRRTADGASLAEILAGLADWADDDLDAADAPAAPTADTRERHLTFRSAGGRYAIPMAAVREVLRSLPLAPVPGTPPWVAGVANVRGDIVTVVDLAAFLGQDAAADPHALVLLTTAGDEHVLALAVDDVLGIRPLPPGAAGTATPDEHLARFLRGVTVDDAGVVHHLAPDLFVAAVEATAATV